MGEATPSRRKITHQKRQPEKIVKTIQTPPWKLEVMTPHDERLNSSEVMRPIPLQTTRATTFIGIWNVRTM